MGWRPKQLLPRRRLHRVMLGVVLLLAVAWFAVPQAFVPMIRGKLQGMIAGHLDAKLHIGRLMYSPPFGVRARDVRLVSAGGSAPAGVELLKVGKLDLKLARLPFREGPLVIQNITVHEPEVHLIRTEDGKLIGMHGVVRREAAQSQPAADAEDGRRDKFDVDAPDEAAAEAARAKLSDMFELRHFGVRGGRVVYEDRTRPGLPPVVWKDLDVGMETSQKSKGVYGYKLDAGNGELAKLKSAGSFDLDALVIELGNLKLEVQTRYTDEQSPLPAQVQRVLRDYKVEGRVTLDAAGRFPLRDREAGTYDAKIELHDASGYSPEWDATLDRLVVKMGVTNVTAPPAAPEGGSPAAGEQGQAGTREAGPLRVRLEGLEAVSGDSVVRVDKAGLLLDVDDNTWAVADAAGRVDLGGDRDPLPKKSRPVLAGLGAQGLAEFTFAANGKLRPKQGEYFLMPEDIAVLVYPRGLAMVPSKSPAPLTGIGGGGTVRKARGSRVVVFENLSFNYGGDPVLLDSARLPLPADLRDLKRQTRIEEISGSVDFHRPGPRYPGKFGKVIDNLRPVGLFTIGRDSWFAVSEVEPPLRVRPQPGAYPRIPPGRKSDWYFSVATDSGSFTLTEKRIPLLNMTGDATVSNMLIDVRRLEADVLGGRLTGEVKVTPGGGKKFHGRAYLRGVDLEAVSKVFILPESKGSRLVGEGNLNIEFSGGRPPSGGGAMDALRAEGEFEVLRGDFWTIPGLGEIAKEAGGGREMTVGEAAGSFSVDGRTITLRNTAVSSPALGLYGSGKIQTEKKALDLQVVAIPLGDWKDKMKQTNVPVLSDVAGELIGAVQGLLNTATRELLYEFRVTGSVRSPKVAAVPAPALSDTAAFVFGRMLGGNDKRRLLETVRESDARGGEPRQAAERVRAEGERDRRRDEGRRNRPPKR